MTAVQRITTPANASIQLWILTPKIAVSAVMSFKNGLYLRTRTASAEFRDMHIYDLKI